MKSIRQLLAAKGNTVYTVGPEATVFESLQLLAEHDVGALVVLDAGGELIGLISERDYARKVILKGRSSRDIRVGEVMTANPTCVDSKQSVLHCMRLMTEGRYRHLPVVEQGQLAGIVSLGDVVKSVIEDQRSTIEELETYIHDGR